MNAPDPVRVYLDPACLLLLATDQPPGAALNQRLQRHVQAEGQIYTSAAALETVQQFFLERRDAASLREFWNGLDGLFREILPLRGEDLGRALDVLEYSRSAVAESGVARAGLTSGQALHAAIALNHEIEWMADPENCYGAVPGIKAFEF